MAKQLMRALIDLAPIEFALPLAVVNPFGRPGWCTGVLLRT